MRSRTRLLLVATLTAALTACTDAASITASNCPCYPPPAPPAPVLDHGAATVYVAVAPESIFGSRPSRYVLYADGTLVLEIYPNYKYEGRYTVSSGNFSFTWSLATAGLGAWGATAVVRGDDLDVTYNLSMGMSDFENGTYRLQR